MKRNVLKISIGIMFISLCVILFVINNTSAKPTGTLDLEGGNDFWHASLNIHLQYDTELIITPQRDDFNIPPEISADIVVNDKCVYTGILKYIPNSNKNSLGKYMVSMDSDNIISGDYFKKDNSEINIIIRFNNQSSSILLR